MITTTFNDGVLYMVGRYTVIPGSRNCERSAVSTDYTVKPGIGNCYIIKIIKTGLITLFSTIRNIGFVKYGFV
jgi:hypothetical protein